MSSGQVVKKEITVYKGKAADLSGTPSYDDLPLLVTTSNQTDFNIFVVPLTSKHYLLIDGVEYYLTSSYQILQVGPNVVLRWLNEFPLSTTDNLIFRKFKS